MIIENMVYDHRKYDRVSLNGNCPGEHLKEEAEISSDKASGAMAVWGAL